jgi:hypothetical protein
MKVLKKGRPQKGWSGEFDCTGKGNGGGGCGAKLLVEFGDLYHTYHYDYDGGHDVYVTFSCAACGVETDIDYRGPNYSSIPDKRRAAAGGARD